MSKPLRSEDGFLYRCPRSDALIVVGRCPDPIIEPTPPPPPPPPLTPRVLVFGVFQNANGPRNLAVWTGDFWDYPNSIDPGITDTVLSASEMEGHFLALLVQASNTRSLLAISPSGGKHTVYTYQSRSTSLFFVGTLGVQRSSTFPGRLLVHTLERPSGVDEKHLYLWDPTPFSLGDEFVPLPRSVGSYNLDGSNVVTWRGRVWATFWEAGVGIGRRLYSMGSDGVWTLDRQLTNSITYWSLGVVADRLIISSTNASSQVKVERYDGSTLTDITHDLAGFNGAPHNIVDWDGDIVLIGDKSGRTARDIFVFDGVSSWSHYDASYPEQFPIGCRMNADSTYLYCGFTRAEGYIRRAPIGGGFEEFPLDLGTTSNDQVYGIETLG